MCHIARLLLLLSFVTGQGLKAQSAEPQTISYQAVLPFSISLHPLPFWTDVFPLPKTQSQKPSSPAQELRQTLRNLKNAKTPEAKAELSYHAALLMAHSSLEDKQILTFVEQTATAALSPDRQKQIALLQIMLALQSLDAQKRMKATQDLQGIYPSLGRYSSLLSSLVLARSRAGYDRQGRKVRKAQPDSLAPLELVSRLCQGYSDKERQALFQFSASVWVEAQKDLGPSPERPFRFECYTKSPGFAAFLERLALAHLLKDPSSYEPTLVLYQKVRESLPPGQPSLDIAWRIQELDQGRSLAKSDKAAYENSMIKGLKSFVGTPYASKLTLFYLNWVRNELQTALKQDPKSASIVQTRQIWERFRTNYPNPSEAKAQTALYIQVLLHFGFRDEAIEQWYQLASDPGMNLRVDYSEKALQLASEKYSIDFAEPFLKPFPQDPQELDLLYRLLTQRLNLGAARQRPLWHYQLTLAIVESKTQRLVPAQKRLLSLLKNLPQPTVYGSAFNLALKVSLQLEDWTQGEILARMGIQKSLSLTDEELATVGLKGILSMSLEKQIQALIAKKDLSAVPSKMEALLQVLGPSPKRNETLYRLAVFYRQAKDYDKTLTALRRLEREELIDSNSKNGLREQGRIHLLRAEFADSLRAYQKLLELHPEDSDVDSIWALVGDLQSVNQRPIEARLAYKKAFALSSEAAQKETLAYKVLRLAQEQKQTKWLQEDLEEWSSYLQEQARLRAIYLGSLYQERALQGELPPADLRKQFSPEEQQLLAVSDLIAWSELRHAISRHQKRMEATKRLLLEKKAEAISNLNKDYQTLHVDYSRACAQGAGNVCLQGTVALLNETIHVRGYLKDLVLADTDSQLDLERQRFLAATESDESMLQDRVRELEAMGPIDPRWRRSLAKDSPDPTTRWLWSAEGAFSSLALLEEASPLGAKKP